jgi:hypothetical protein
MGTTQKTIETKTFRAFIKTYCLFKIGHLRTNIKLTLYKVLIRSVTTYASPPWENPSGEKLLEMLDINEFNITAPQCPTHYSPAGNGDVLDIVVYKNIRLSHVTVSDILDSYPLPIVSHNIDHVSVKNSRNQSKNLEI